MLEVKNNLKRAKAYYEIVNAFSATIRWTGHLERMGQDELTKTHKNGINAMDVRRRPSRKWEDRMLENLRKKGDRRMKTFENARVECMDRNKWRFFCHGHPLEEFQNQAS